MTTFTDNNHLILPSEYIKNANMFQVKGVFQTKSDSEGIDDIESIENYIENDFENNFELHVKENGIKEGNDESDEMFDFADEYPYCYFFLDFENFPLDFRDKNIFIIELINLLDISEEMKTEVLDESVYNRCIVVKLKRLLRNLNTDPIPDISELQSITAKINFKNMYDDCLEY